MKEIKLRDRKQKNRPTKSTTKSITKSITTVNKSGRPVGTGGGQKLSSRLNNIICKSLDILERDYNTNLETLIAQKMVEDAPAVLSKIQKILPAPDININHQHSAFITALSTISDIIEGREDRPEAVELEHHEVH